MKDEVLSRLRIIAGILQSQTGSPESILERALNATESLGKWIAEQSEPFTLTDAQIDEAAFREAFKDSFASMEQKS